MKTTLVTYQKVFPLAQYLNERIGVEVQIDDGESAEKALDLAKKTVEQWHKQQNPHLYQEQANKIPVVYTPTDPEPPKEYNLQEEKTAIAIENATTIEELEQIKTKCHTVWLFQKFQERKKQLTQ